MRMGISHVQVALEGDLVYVHYDCTDENGEVRALMSTMLQCNRHQSEQ